MINSWKSYACVSSQGYFDAKWDLYAYVTNLYRQLICPNKRIDIQCLFSLIFIWMLIMSSNKSLWFKIGKSFEVRFQSILRRKTGKQFISDLRDLTRWQSNDYPWKTRISIGPKITSHFQRCYLLILMPNWNINISANNINFILINDSFVLLQFCYPNG